jgi:predicted naringenin-chalcone synthase
MSAFEMHAGNLAVAAARQALMNGHTDPRHVTHLITVTCTGFSSPGVDYALIQELQLPRDVARTQVGFMGCHAALNAIRVAKAFVAADPTAVVLVCCVELCTLHYQYGWDPEQIVAMSLFGDGAAACVVQSRKTLASADTRPYVVAANGAVVLEDCAESMSWRIGDHGFRMTLSPAVPELISRSLLPWLTEWLKPHDQRPETIANWAVHPGGPRILQAFLEATGLDQNSISASREVLNRYGNMSSCTLLFVLETLRERPRPTVALGFGPGLAIEALLLQ